MHINVIALILKYDAYKCNCMTEIKAEIQYELNTLYYTVLTFNKN